MVVLLVVEVSDISYGLIVGVVDLDAFAYEPVVAVAAAVAVASSGPHHPFVENLRPSWDSVWQCHSPT